MLYEWALQFRALYTTTLIADMREQMTMQNVSTTEPTISQTDRQYWICQFYGWGALTVFSILSLNIWYTPGEFAPLFHSALQSLVGIVLSHPLRYVARITWNDGLSRRILINTISVLLAASLWTVWRITSFTWLTGEVIEVSDWGGWINVSVIVFVGWSSTYHALKYYRQSIEQQRLAIEAQNSALAAEAKAHRENAKRVEAEKLTKESQLRMLKYQLNPHFFLNALNSVSALVRKNKRDEAMEMLARIGDFLRLSLDDTGDLFHTIEEEIDAVQSYLEIEKIRFGERLATEFEIDPSILDFKVPTMLMQPVFENAIKHAVSKSQSPTTIRFEAAREAHGVRLSVQDDGSQNSGNSKAQTAETLGIGLANVQSRLESAFGNNYQFSIRRSNAGYNVDILINEETAPLR